MEVGGAHRREPSRRLHERKRSRRSLGSLRREVRLRKARVQRDHGPFHTARMEQYDDGGVREDGVQWSQEYAGLLCGL